MRPGASQQLEGEEEQKELTMKAWLPLKLVFPAGVADVRVVIYQGTFPIDDLPTGEVPIAVGFPTKEFVTSPVMWCVGTH